MNYKNHLLTTALGAWFLVAGVAADDRSLPATVAGHDDSGPFDSRTSDEVRPATEQNASSEPSELIPPLPDGTVPPIPAEPSEQDPGPRTAAASLANHAAWEGFVDPRYVTTVDASMHDSTCSRCGRKLHHCPYAPFGDSLRAAFGRQIHLGAAELMTLYAYDFHPDNGPHAAELTTRGLYQLRKIAGRLPHTPARIKIESAENAELNAARRAHVVETLGGLGIADAAEWVVVVRTRPGRPALEMLENAAGLLENIRARGRTIQGGESATFSGGVTFGQ